MKTKNRRRKKHCIKTKDDTYIIPHNHKEKEIWLWYCIIPQYWHSIESMTNGSTSLFNELWDSSTSFSFGILSRRKNNQQWIFFFFFAFSFVLCWGCGVVSTPQAYIATGWKQWMRKRKRKILVLSCLQHEPPLQHQHCVATQFSPEFEAPIRLKTQTEEQASPNEKLGRVPTWMLLWAKKGQNREWKLTSTFFHPSCCNPRIISSVNKQKAVIIYRHATVGISFKELSRFLQINVSFHCLENQKKIVTFHYFMIFQRILSAGCILCRFLSFGRFWWKMGAIGGNWGTILNTDNMLVTIQRLARGLSIE